MARFERRPHGARPQASRQRSPRVTLMRASAERASNAVSDLPERLARWSHGERPRRLGWYGEDPTASSGFGRVSCGKCPGRMVLTGEEYARDRLRQLFAREGVHADRLDFAERTSRRSYLERYRQIDVGLDSFPYGGATTTLDAAWMGVPVVTLTGPRALQRAGVCVASNLGLSELVASNEDEFVQMAGTLAADLGRLSELRSGLRSRLQGSPLGDEARFVRNLEAVYRTAWRHYCTATQKTVTPFAAPPPLTRKPGSVSATQPSFEPESNDPAVQCRLNRARLRA